MSRRTTKGRVLTSLRLEPKWVDYLKLYVEQQEISIAEFARNAVKRELSNAFPTTTTKENTYG